MGANRVFSIIIGVDGAKPYLLMVYLNSKRGQNYIERAMPTPLSPLNETLPTISNTYCVDLLFVTQAWCWARWKAPTNSQHAKAVP